MKISPAQSLLVAEKKAINWNRMITERLNLRAIKYPEIIGAQNAFLLSAAKTHYKKMFKQSITKLMRRRT